MQRSHRFQESFFRFRDSIDQLQRSLIDIMNTKNDDPRFAQMKSILEEKMTLFDESCDDTLRLLSNAKRKVNMAYQTDEENIFDESQFVYIAELDGPLNGLSSEETQDYMKKIETVLDNVVKPK